VRLWGGWRPKLKHLLFSLGTAALLCSALGLALQSTARPTGAVGATLDADRDGWNDGAELSIGTDPGRSCGDGGWPADLVHDGFQPDALNLQDMASFISPVRHLNTGPGDRGFDARWDLAPGSAVGKSINIADIATLITGSTGYPPMFNGQRAFGRVCSAAVTPSPTPPDTSTQTATPAPTDTPTPTSTDTPTPTPTDTPSPIETPSETPKPTEAPTPTDTPTPTPTDTPTSTPTDTPTETPTETPTDTPTQTDAPIPTEIPTPTKTPTQTPTDPPTPTETAALTETPTATPTDSPTPTDTPTPTPTDTPIPTPTDTPTPTETPIPTPTPTPTATPSPTASPTPAPPSVGHRGPSYLPASAPTADKPQSKLWFNDGTWWASMFAGGVQEYHIFRLDPATQSWSDTGTLIDARNASKSDGLWNGSKLYVVSAGPSSAVATDDARFQRFSYNAVTDLYTPDTFAASVVPGGMEAAVLAQDTSGTLWLTYTRGNAVYVSHSTTSDFVWTTPYVLPVENAANLTPDDISSVIAYNSRIGVMWSNQNATAIYFASHVDGAADTEWNMSTALGAPYGGDDHINLKSLEGDPAGRIFAAVKTGANGLNDPSIMLLVLGTDATWTHHVFSKVADNHTRPLVLIDEDNRALYMFAAAPCCNGGTVYYKQTSLDTILFPTGPGMPFMQSSGDDCINNPSSTKQNLNATTDLVVIAGADCTDFYFHNMSDLAAP